MTNTLWGYILQIVKKNTPQGYDSDVVKSNDLTGDKKWEKIKKKKSVAAVKNIKSGLTKNIGI